MNLRKEINKKIILKDDKIEIYKTDKACLLYVEKYETSNGEYVPNLNIITDGEKVSKYVFILEAGESIWIEDIEYKDIVFALTMSSITRNEDDDIDYLINFIKLLSSEYQTMSDKNIGYLLDKQEALTAYDLVQNQLIQRTREAANHNGKVSIRKVVNKVINK